MKNIFIVLSLAISLHATPTLSQKIASLKETPKAQRYQLLNSIKRDLAKLNRTQRSEALQQLRHSMQTKGKHQGQANGMKHRYRQQRMHQGNEMQTHQRKMDGSGAKHGENSTNQPPQQQKGKMH